MKINDLIKQLQTFDGDMDIIIHHNGMHDIELYEGSLIVKPCIWMKTLEL